MSNINHFNEYFKNVAATLDKLDIACIDKFVNALIECYNKSGAIYIMGNGGSGATASHVCGDFIKGVSYGLPKRFRFVSLNDNMAAILAIANDLSYDDIFVEQLKGGLNADDIVIGISGSGNSINVIKALEYAKAMNVKTVALSGFKGGKIKEIADISVHVPVSDMEITEDIHLIIFHAIKQAIVKLLKSNNTSSGANYDNRIK